MSNIQEARNRIFDAETELSTARKLLDQALKEDSIDEKIRVILSHTGLVINKYNDNYAGGKAVWFGKDNHWCLGESIYTKLAEIGYEVEYIGDSASNKNENIIKLCKIG